jgi:hypothetical protein
MTRLLLACALALLLCPSFAGAATVNGNTTLGANLIRFQAAPGETNEVTIGSEAPGSAVFDVHDAGAVLQPSGTCASVDPHTVACTLSPSPGAAVMAQLGDGDDSFTLTGPGPNPVADVDGGPGNDTITGACTANGGDGDDTITLCDTGAAANGGPGNDTITGGAGGDVLTGGGGRDVLRGGANDDFLNDGDGARGTPIDGDTLDGGPGMDTLYYGDRTKPVSVDLATQGSAGSPGENDVISGIEDVTGGAGADTLIGGDGPNQIRGRAGADTIEGGGGVDELDGGPGSDTIDSGPGDDLIYALDLFRDRITCSGGNDAIYVEPGDRLAPDCGTPARDSVQLIRQHRLRAYRGGVVHVELFCNSAVGPSLEETFGQCTGRVSLRVRVGRHWVEAGARNCTSGHCVGFYQVKLPRSIRKRLARTHRLSAEVSYVPAPGRKAGALAETRPLPLLRATR